MRSMKEPFQMITEFHETFSPREVTSPTALTPEQTAFRAEFKVEELVELLYSSANNDPEVFQKLVADLKVSIDKACEKVLKKDRPVSDPLIEEVDALADLLYFTYGTFYLMGIDPTKILEIVHQANMSKLFPDGKPHYHPITNKVLKPDNWERDYAPEPQIKAEIQRQISAATKTERQ